MKLTPTYRIFPEPSESDKKGRWIYDTELIWQIQVRCGGCQLQLELEDVECVLLAIEDIANKADVQEGRKP